MWRATPCPAPAVVHEGGVSCQPAFILLTGTTLMMLDEKLKRTRDIIRRTGSLLVAFSGGIDSTLLAHIAHTELAGNCRCVLVDSPLVPRAAVRQAEAVAGELGIDLEILRVPLPDDPVFCSNPPDRCSACKKIMAAHLKKLALERGISHVADGSNISDTNEYRPGLATATEEGILHPFIDARCTKEDIRTIAKKLGISTWQQPSSACLASRIPYGDPITTEKLHQIEEAEKFLAGLGISQLRVRVHGSLARIEVPFAERDRILEHHAVISQKFHALKFTYVTLDLDGFRTGSMDEVIRRKPV